MTEITIHLTRWDDHDRILRIEVESQDRGRLQVKLSHMKDTWDKSAQPNEPEISTPSFGYMSAPDTKLLARLLLKAVEVAACLEKITEWKHVEMDIGEARWEVWRKHRTVKFASDGSQLIFVEK